MYSLLDLSEKSPIKHEMMHIILSKNLGSGYTSMRWFNEGLATYSGTMCGKTNFDEMYYYMLKNDYLISMELMTMDFYNQDEVIGYTQAAYIVKYLSEVYGWEKTKMLWTKGFSQFKDIFEKSYAEVEKDMHASLEDQFNGKTQVNWEQFIKGCPN